MQQLLRTRTRTHKPTHVSISHLRDVKCHVLLSFYYLHLTRDVSYGVSASYTVSYLTRNLPN